MTSTYQQHVLNDGHVCMSCMGRLRRKVSKPVPYKHADVDENQNRVRDGEAYVTQYPERLPWRTTRETVPDEAVTDADWTFCECGADGAYTRIWDDRDIDAARLRDLLKQLVATLEAKGFAVDARQLARRADELYHELPPAGVPGRGIGPAPADAPTTINEVLEEAVEVGVVGRREDAPDEREVPA